MKVILKDGRRYILRFDRGEEIITSLRDFSAKEEFKAGFFSGLGAVSKVVLLHYDVDTKKYSEKTFGQKMEIVNLSGNLSWHEDSAYLHAHGTFSDEGMQCFGGHIKEAIVAATCEMFLIHMDGEIGREFSSEVGLNLLK